MSEAFLIWMSAGIMLLIGVVNIVLTVYTWELLKSIRNLLESNIYLNTEAIDLIRYGVNRGYERGIDDTLKKVTQKEADHE